MRGTRRASGTTRARAVDALLVRAFEKVVAVEMETVEEERRERQPLCIGLRVCAAAEPAHRDLEGIRPAVRSQGDHLPVENHRVDGESEHRGDNLRDAVGDVRKAPRERAHLAAETVHLQSRAVQLPLRCRRAGAVDRGRDVLGRLRQHRLDGTKHLEAEPGKALGPSRERRPGDGR